MPTIEWIAVDALAPNACNARTHSRKQIRQIADSIAAFGFLVPILVDEDRVVIAGHGRYAAAKLLGLKQVPAIEVQGLSEAKRRALAAAAAVSRDGAVHFVCIDWRHIGELLEAGGAVYGETLNLAVWVKSNAGQGSFYRSQHELVSVFRVGEEAHLNNIELGRHGRSRSNVWHYAGVNTFRAGRLDELQSHPTVKPVALVADAMKDCTRRGDIVLDTFCGSGTTILAAERVGRRAYTLELEPRFVDVTIKRWQAFSRRDVIHAETGLTFDEVASDRTPAPAAAAAQTDVCCGRTAARCESQVG
jgi:hypothetical protein